MMKLHRSNTERIPAQKTRYRLDGGFTLTELVVTIAIAAILMTLAVPSFNNVIAAERAKAAASELYSSLIAARSAAIRLNERVTISEEAGGWQNGWSTKSLTTSTVVDEHGATRVTTLQEASGATSVTYYPSGRLALGTTPSFHITATAGNATSDQCLSLDPTGTPYMQAGSTC